MRKTLLLALCSLLVLAAGAMRASGTIAADCDMIASKSGSDTGGDGSLERPFRTVQKLVDNLTPGVTGCVRGWPRGSQPDAATGLYEEDVTVTHGGRSKDARVTVRSFPTEVAHLKGRLRVDASYVRFSQLVLDGRNSGHHASPQIAGNGVSFVANNVTSRKTGSCFNVGGTPQVKSVVIEGNRVHDCKYGVVLSSAYLTTVRLNLVYDNLHDGVRLLPNADRSRIFENVIDGNRRGIHIGGGTQAGSATYQKSQSNTADGNIISYSSGYSISEFWPNAPADPQSIGSLGASRNCLWFPKDPQGGGIQAPRQGIQETSNVRGEPRHLDRARGDFHIDSSSPCWGMSGDIAASVDAPSVTNGFDEGAPADEQAINLRPPNVLFIVTDDQRAEGTVIPEVMPKTLQWLGEGGTYFPEGVATTPLCCPARASIFSGRYAHNHGVKTNPISNVTTPPGSNPDFERVQQFVLDHPTLQHYLQGAGYRTGIVGKFLNFYFDASAPMPNWNQYFVIDSGYCPFQSNENGTVRVYPEGGWQDPDGLCPADQRGVPGGAPYSTDYVATQAATFIRDAEADDSRPWFLYVAPLAPHLGGRMVEAQYRDFCHPYQDNPASFEQDRSDKPQYVQQINVSRANLVGTPPCDASDQSARTSQLRTLRSADDLVGTLFQELSEKGEESDTLVVFIGDNGYLWGEHGLEAKEFPYTDSLEIPFFMRWTGNPNVGRNVTDQRLVANIDLAPTALDIVGLYPDPPMDGTSLIGSESRDRILAESWTKPGTPHLRTWASIRTAPSAAAYQYMEYYAEGWQSEQLTPLTESQPQDDGTSAVREYYNLFSDPFQLTNLLKNGSASDDPSTVSIAAQLAKDRRCRGHGPPDLEPPPCP